VVRSAELAHQWPWAWLGSSAEEPSPFWQKPMAGLVAGAVKHQGKLTFCEVSIRGATICIACAGTDQAGQDQASAPEQRMGPVPSRLTPRCTVRRKRARASFFLPQTNQRADGGGNPSSQFLLDQHFTCKIEVGGFKMTCGWIRF